MSFIVFEKVLKIKEKSTIEMLFNFSVIQKHQ